MSIINTNVSCFTGQLVILALLVQVMTARSDCRQRVPNTELLTFCAKCREIFEIF